MADSFARLSPEKRLQELKSAANASNTPIPILEKDVWIVWALQTLFAAPFGEHLVFKGGTSLSKCYGVIRRFSEDVDITYDIRQIIPDLIGESADPLPPTRSQEKKWTTAARERLALWTADTVAPTLKKALQRDDLASATKLRIDGYKLFIDYAPLTTDSGYVGPPVTLEFGARSTGEPWERRSVACDAAAHLPMLSFPTAVPRVMRMERTCWEKMMAAHVYCLKRRMRAERFSRHWYDLTHLDAAGRVDAALRDRDLAVAVARHQTMFFVEKDAGGQRIDYEAAISGRLALVPEGEARDQLARDYASMAEGRFLPDDSEDFESIMDKCRDIEERANGS